MRFVTLVTLGLIFAGCESDVDKLQRLETNKLVSCLAAQRRYDVMDSTRKAGDPHSILLASYEALNDSLQSTVDALRTLNAASGITREWRRKSDSVIAEGDRLQAAGRKVNEQLKALPKASAISEPPELTRLRAAWSMAQAQCELATREYDRFMR